MKIGIFQSILAAEPLSSGLCKWPKCTASLYKLVSVWLASRTRDRWSNSWAVPPQSGESCWYGDRVLVLASISQDHLGLDLLRFSVSVWQEPSCLRLVLLIPNRSHHTSSVTVCNNKRVNAKPTASGMVTILSSLSRVSISIAYTFNTSSGEGKDAKLALSLSVWICWTDWSVQAKGTYI